AEAGGEDQLVALPRQVAHDALGVGALGHALDKTRLDAVRELLLDGLAAQVVLEGPAAIPDGADVHEANLELVGDRRGGRDGCRRGGGGGLFLLATAGKGGGDGDGREQGG